MEKKVTLDCGATLNVWHVKHSCLILVDLTGLTMGSVSPDASDSTKATIRISVMNLPAIKKLVDAALKNPDVKARIKQMKKAGSH
jgi:hypothetical protein